MQLFPGFEQEYLKRHEQIWPELKALLKEAGISDYSIFLDKESLTLFGVMQVTDEEAQNGLKDHPIMKRWWAYMKDIMASNPDNSPVTAPLELVFHLE
ncbi:L-rhamnose mutarotase [Ravibacter arvi]|uniref:L-rhamnose mutarotase n=1 Tax=Ravibacter arvi TaxID=2051041 RepID=A0ABP8M9M1_9BACT